MLSQPLSELLLDRVPAETNVEGLSPVSVTVNLFGDKVSAGDQIKMRPLGWVPVQYDVPVTGPWTQRDTCRESVVSRLEFWCHKPWNSRRGPRSF